MQKKKSNTSIENIKHLALSIQFSLDGFSFCVKNSETKATVFFTEYLFDQQLITPIDLLENITAIFKSDKNLHFDFNQVAVIHENNLSTLVPQELFDEKLLKNYLDYNIKTLPTDYIAFDELQHTKANNVYIPYVNINNYLFQHFGEFEYKHHISVFIDKILTLNTNSIEKRMFVNVSKNSFNIVVIEGKELLFSNLFSYNTKEDFLYYILFVTEQLKLNPEEFKLYFTGKIDQESEVFKLCYKYIRNLDFLESSNAIFNSLESPKHSHFMLL